MKVSHEVLWNHGYGRKGVDVRVVKATPMHVYMHILVIVLV